MAEEFAIFINELNKEPIEEQISKLKDVVSKMVGIITKFIDNFVDNYTSELKIIHNKIISLETKDMKSKLPKLTVLSTSAPPPPPQVRPVGNENVRKVILGELKDLFKKE